jgi:hypothetical protein
VVLGKICKYYHNSKCLYKRTYCDLYCGQMKYYGEDESDGLEEETFNQENNDSLRFKRQEIILFL